MIIQLRYPTKCKVCRTQLRKFDHVHKTDKGIMCKFCGMRVERRVELRRYGRI
jgi:hypothetical protein